MRRLLAFFLSLLLLLGSCGPRSESPGTSPLPPKPSAPPSSAVPEPTPEPADDALVDLESNIPSLYIDLKYAGTDNFTGQVIYDFTRPLLRWGTVKKLQAAAAALEDLGYCLLIWDAYRPIAAQFRLWEACPDPAYVADPHHGTSSHSRGNTLDLTLCLPDGTPVAMPTGFDDFSSLADRDYRDVTDPEVLAHVQLLEDIMTACGFTGYAGEWWHFSDTTSYPPAEDGQSLFVQQKNEFSEKSRQIKKSH